MLRAFIQARMSSKRFPGKVLAPLTGTPLLGHVVERVSRVVPRDRIVIATSSHTADDPIVGYAGMLGVAAVRGPLTDVFARFRACLAEHPCEWFVRVCADSPLVDPALLARMTALAGSSDADLITNVQRRTFPKGQSLELLRAVTFLAVDPGTLDDGEREHLTRYFYARPERFRIVNIEREGPPATEAEHVVVDTLEDLRRLEATAR